MKPCLLLLAAIFFAGNASAADEPVLTGPRGCKVVNLDPHDEDSITWSGACQDGYATGEGKLVWFMAGTQTMSYEGKLLHGLPNGEGRLEYPDSSAYEGHLSDGKANGEGRYVGADGSSYDGNWKDGLRDGDGSQRYASGGRYDGMWKAGKFHGQGRAVYSGGQVLEGEFTAGAAPGQGPAEKAAEPELFQLKSKARNRRPGIGAEAPIAINAGFSFDKSYAAMSPSEQRAVRAAYPLLHAQDEPPFPLNGIEAFTRKAHQPTVNYEQKGYLRLLAQIDATGKVTSVRVYGAPDKALFALAADLLKQETFKPGKCAGTPCAMSYVYEVPFNMASYPGTPGGAPLISRDPRDAMRVRTGI